MIVLGLGVDVSHELLRLDGLGEDALDVDDLASLLLGHGERLDALALATARGSNHQDLNTQHVQPAH